jgi:hypothetical protein
MSLYSLEAKSSVARLSGHDIVPDSSYVINLIRVNGPYHKAADTFHWAALTAGAKFCINVTVRYELLRNIRKGYLLTTLRDLKAANPSLKVRYDRLRNNPDDILKDFIKEATTTISCRE